MNKKISIRPQLPWSLLMALVAAGYMHGNVLNAQEEAAVESTTEVAATEVVESTFDGNALLDQADDALESGDLNTARALLDEYEDTLGYDRKSRSTSADIRKKALDPSLVDIDEASPNFKQEQRTIEDLIRKGRAQFIASDLNGAQQSFNDVEARDPNNADAKYFLWRIAEVRSDSSRLDIQKTREEMLAVVGNQWQLPKVFDREQKDAIVDTGNVLRKKMEGIKIPQVNFNGTPLRRVVDTLHALSADASADAKGINMIVLDQSGADPAVTITLSDLNLVRILELVTQTIGYTFEIQEDVVTITPATETGPGAGLTTEFFPINKSIIIRMTGITDSGGGGGSANPFDVAPASSGGDQGEELDAIKAFLQRAGVPFDSVPGADVAMGDGELIVTNTRNNLERVQRILRRFRDVKQVEIESKFLEIEQNALEELGFTWTFGSDGRTAFDPNTGLPAIGPDGRPEVAYDQSFTTQNRTLTNAFTTDTAQSAILINGEIVAQNRAPDLPSTIDVASGVADLISFGGIINDVNIDAMIRAIERDTGSDLMSAPKVTVLSGKTAEIVVAQELRFPESYGDIESEVGTGSGGGLNSGGAGVTITAGTPQDFVTRNVGVEMEVIPTVESDNSISLQLEPVVTEFEGFVEYGGPSVAISGGTEVIVPAGFYQPIFSVRRVRTEVTIWDGATVVLGGLTREQIVSIDDRVPVLGDMPLIGRLFRSEGESTRKRNLLIFVTANLVSPGGSPARQDLGIYEAGTMYQNPIIVTPGGAVTRGVKEQAESEE